MNPAVARGIEGRDLLVDAAASRLLLRRDAIGRLLGRHLFGALGCYQVGEFNGEFALTTFEQQEGVKLHESGTCLARTTAPYPPWSVSNLRRRIMRNRATEGFLEQFRHGGTGLPEAKFLEVVRRCMRVTLTNSSVGTLDGDISVRVDRPCQVCEYVVHAPHYNSGVRHD